MRELPSQEYLKECFDYDPESGRVEWRCRPAHHFASEQYARMSNTRNAGNPVGSTKGRYAQVNMGTRKCYLHRLIWKLVTGEEPDVIDHINGDVRDNRWVNLRSVSAKESSRNLPRTCKNTSGTVGVSFVEKRNRWMAHIKTDGVMKNLGEFRYMGDAIAARKAAEKQYGFHPNHGRVKA